MSLKEQILQWFRDNPEKKIDNAGICEALDVDDSQQVSVALNALHNEFGVKRDRKAEGEGRGFNYWLPSSVAAELDGSQSPAPRTPKALDPKEVVARLARDRGAPPSEPKKRGPKPGTKRAKAKKPRAAAKAKPAKKAKRTYTRRPPQPVQTPAPEQGATDAVFGIRNDGALGIDIDGSNVRLPKAAVQLLQAFLKTTSPLWS